MGKKEIIKHCKSKIIDCSSTINQALKANSAFTSQNFEAFISYFASNGILYFHANSATTAGIPLIPFSGEFQGPEQILNFLIMFFQIYTTEMTFSPIQSIQFNKECLASQTSVTLFLTYTTKFMAGPVKSQTFILPLVNKYTFNTNGQIQRLDIYTDISGPLMFYISIGL